MANRPKGYGMSAEVKRKIEAKYDTNDEMEVRYWIEAVLGIELDPSAAQDEPLGQKKMQEVLKSGIILCQLAQAVVGPSACKFKEKSMAFIQMENISNFLGACEKYGVAKTDLFQTVDLYEGQNMLAVLTGIQAFSRKAQAHGFDGPTIGPKESTKNVRDFSAETMNAGQSVIGLQMGTNKVASQSGLSMGKPRGIMGVDK